MKNVLLVVTIVATGIFSGLVLGACDHAASDAPELKTTEPEALSLPPGFQESYVELQSDHFDIPGTKRVSINVQVPKGLSRHELGSNMRAAISKELRSGPGLGAIDVLAYLKGTPWRTSSFDAARATFAPNGDWSSASATIPISDWRLTIQYANSYFAPPVKLLAPGTKVVLADQLIGHVALSRSPTSWQDADIIVRLRQGTHALVLSARDHLGVPGLVRYQVRVGHREGWVF